MADNIESIGVGMWVLMVCACVAVSALLDAFKKHSDSAGKDDNDADALRMYRKHGTHMLFSEYQVLYKACRKEHERMIAEENAAELRRLRDNLIILGLLLLFLAVCGLLFAWVGWTVLSTGYEWYSRTHTKRVAEPVVKTQLTRTEEWFLDFVMWLLKE